MLLFFMLLIVFSIGFLMTGALVATVFWMFVKLPMSLIVMTAGLLLCCTIIGIPVGMPLIKAGFCMLIPGL